MQSVQQIQVFADIGGNIASLIFDGSDTDDPVGDVQTVANTRVAQTETFPVIAKTVPPAPAAGVTVSAAIVAGGVAVGRAGRATGEVARGAVAVRAALRPGAAAGAALPLVPAVPPHAVRATAAKRVASATSACRARAIAHSPLRTGNDDLVPNAARPTPVSLRE